MINKAVREEWKQYLFEEGRDYTLDEAIKKFIEAIGFLKSKCMRVSENMLLDGKKYDLEFRLSRQEKTAYIQKFNKEGYAINDCATIVKVMDTIYHTFDVSKEKAFEMAKYAADNHLTITQTVNNKLNVDFKEMGEFTDIVLPELLDYLKYRTASMARN